MEGRHVQIRMNARQVAKNVSYTGGFFAALTPLIARALPLAARALPTIMSGLATGLLSGGVHKAISVSGVAGGDGWKHRSDVSDGAGLLMGKNSPFKNIPVLGWLL